MKRTERIRGIVLLLSGSALANIGLAQEPPPVGRPDLVIQSGHRSWINFLDFSRDGRLLLSASLADRVAKVWEVSAGRELRTIREFLPKFTVDSASLSWRDGDFEKRLEIATGKESSLRYRPTTPEVAGQPDLRIIAFTDEGLAASAPKASVPLHGGDGISELEHTRQGTITIWEKETGSRLANLRGHNRGILHAEFAANGETLVSASYDGTVKAWGVSSGRELATLPGPVQFQVSPRAFEGHVFALSFSADGNWAASTSGPEIRVWELKTGRVRHLLTSHKRSVGYLSFTSDGHRLLSQTNLMTHHQRWPTAEAILWDLVKGNELVRVKATASTLSPSGHLLAWACGTEIVLREVGSGSEVRKK